MNHQTHPRFLTCLMALCLLGATAGGWALEKKPLGTGALNTVKNKVQAATGSEKTPLVKGGEVAEGNKVDTGSDACTEMTFTDSSVLRLGQNSKFSFDSKGRVIKLDQGTLLMHVPPGNGGISIEGGGVLGAVSGSTVMASSDGKGNFAFAILESDGGSGQITNKDGSVTPLTPGQMGVVSAARPGVSVSFEVNITGLMESSPLFTEFVNPMPGIEKVTAVAEKQGEAIESGVKVLEKTPNADDKSARVEDPAVEAFSAFTGLPPEECSQAPNLILEPFKRGEGMELNPGTMFSMNTDAGGEVSARVASGSAEFVPAGSSSGVQIGSNQGFSSSSGQVASLPSSDNFTGNMAVVGDARSAEGKSIAANSAQPSSGGPGDVATAAGSEGPGSTDTAAGGGRSADTQAPLPPVTSNPTPGQTTPT
ncbi:MAG: hypothetical protein EBT57_05955 [Verrucomicrobia bacterium]|nr:hypothetical protein [Verrucomicrobiota bacterium]